MTDRCCVELSRTAVMWILMVECGRFKMLTLSSSVMWALTVHGGGIMVGASDGVMGAVTVCSCQIVMLAGDRVVVRALIVRYRSTVMLGRDCRVERTLAKRHYRIVVLALVMGGHERIWQHLY